MTTRDCPIVDLQSETLLPDPTLLVPKVEPLAQRRAAKMESRTMPQRRVRQRTRRHQKEKKV